MSEKVIVTAALPYANGPLHIGHLSGAYLPADIYVRFLRMLGKDVLFICGSDENGAAITLKALQEKKAPKEVVDIFHKINKDTFQELGISFDMYSRTSSEIHHKTAKDFFLQLYENKAFEERESMQFYDEKIHFFLTDRYIIGTCPHCSFEKAYGDQCEKCGNSLNANELINPISNLTGEKPKKRKTKHWYLLLEEHQEWIEKWIIEGKYKNVSHHDPKEWKKHVLSQCKSWLTAGLKARAMTRDLDWGVEVPLENSKGKKLYVWLDAPIGYISATKEWAEKNKKEWEPYWKDEKTKLIHFIGKDNIVFHCIIFPILLHIHKGFILPKNIPANAFLNLEGRKISTSRNWAVWVKEYLKDFPGKKDELRYYLTCILPENRDSEFTWKGFQRHINNELLAVIGNFFYRCGMLVNNHFEQRVPYCVESNSIDENFYKQLKQTPQEIEKKILEFSFREALLEVINLVRKGNKYLTDTAPWKLIKTDKNRAGTILYYSLQLCAALSILLNPFLPDSAEKIRKNLNLPLNNWDALKKFPILEENQKLEPPLLLFQAIDDLSIEKQIEKLKINK